jgi:regulator of sigma E protease
MLQTVNPDSTVTLVFQGDRTAQLPIAMDPQWPNPDRGLVLEQQRFVQKADSLGSALRLGLLETGESLTMVVRFLRKLGTQVSPRLMGGPIAIAAAAGRYAYQGIPELLVFLTMLSANLAVLNFLPIPLLDGGHMVFLLWEGIRGKPANERVQMILTYIGLALILGLLLWVLALDTTLIPRYQD